MVAKPTVLINCPISAENESRLAEKYDLHYTEKSDDRDGLIAGIGAEVIAMVTEGPRDVDRAMMDKLPRLALICCQSVGLDAVDLDAAKDKNIVVTNGRGANAPSVADHAFALMLGVYRQVVTNDRLMRAQRADEHLGRDNTWTAYGKKLGILGLGAVGMEIAKRAEGFDMEIFYHNRSRRDDAPYTYCDDMKALGGAVDILSISAPGGDATRHLVDKSVIDLLGPNGVIINVGRGSVVDTAALVDALEAGRLVGAGLDTVDGHSSLRDRLCGLDNVILTPHVAGTTFEADERKNALTQDVLDTFFTGQPVQNRVA